MRHRKVGKILNRKRGPLKALVKNLAQSLILYEKIVTTEAKGRVLRSYVEPLITLGKEPTLAHRRLLLQKLPTHNSVRKVLEVLGPRYASRKGGYVRMTKLAPRVGDRARQVQIEFV